MKIRKETKAMLKLIGLVALAAGVLIGQQTDTVVKMGPGVTAPKVLQKTDPAYTKDASDAKIQGTVLLSMVVGSDGVARDITVKKSLDPGLDEKAIAAVQNWKFQPGTKDGKAVSVMATIEVNFRLQ
jgi:TonB family protein